LVHSQRRAERGAAGINSLVAHGARHYRSQLFDPYLEKARGRRVLGLAGK
jgi:hypothetical protein